MKASSVAFAAAGLLLLGACQGQVADPDDDQSLAVGTRRVIMTYLIAHGMAVSYVMSGRATPASLLDVVGTDHVALVAIQAAAAGPTRSGLAAARRAIGALIDTTTTLESAAAPRRASRAAAR